ncbi:MAG: hypothetical protein ACR2GN_08020 [Bacteroidia bacterium]
MNPVLKNILAVIAGIVAGSAVNMGIIMLSGSIISPPEGVDVSKMESLAENMHLFEPKHFIMPFLAHALGTFVGALVAAYLAASYKMKFALAIGVFFLLGGIANAFMLPAPAWFIILDLLLAYIPMAWLGGRLAVK